MESLASAKMVAVHYRGAGPALNDLVGHHIKAMVLSTALAIPAYKGGRVKMLAVTSPKRLEPLAEVPTLSESWQPGYEASLWFGLFAPRATPREIVDKINADVQRVLADRQFQNTILKPQLLEPMIGSPQQLEQIIKADSERWGKVIRDANLKVE
jgi:tripartite-type tricarboxylate transporter receptor subunit TctC